MSDNVVILDVISRLDVPVERVLNAALDADLEGAVVVGVENGELYFGSSFADGGDVLWWLEKAKMRLLAVGEND